MAKWHVPVYMQSGSRMAKVSYSPTTIGKTIVRVPSHDQAQVPVSTLGRAQFVAIMSTSNNGVLSGDNLRSPQYELHCRELIIIIRQEPNAVVHPLHLIEAKWSQHGKPGIRGMTILTV